MNEELRIFNNEQFGKVTTIEIDGEPWFLGKEISPILGYLNTSESILEHVDEEDRKCLTYKAYSKTVKALWQGNDFSNKIIINESGVYSLILRSKMSKAKEFKHWITSEVLPSIRKTGSYLPQDYLTALKQLVASEEAKQKLALENSVMKPKADYYDNLVRKEHLTNLRDTAKELGIGQKEFIQFLFENEYVYRDKYNRIMPYAKHRSLFEVKDYFNEKNEHCGIQTLVTVEGKQKFRRNVVKESN